MTETLPNENPHVSILPNSILPAYRVKLFSPPPKEVVPKHARLLAHVLREDGFHLDGNEESELLALDASASRLYAELAKVTNTAVIAEHDQMRQEVENNPTPRNIEKWRAVCNKASAKADAVHIRRPLYGAIAKLATETFPLLRVIKSRALDSVSRQISRCFEMERSYVESYDLPWVDPNVDRVAGAAKEKEAKVVKEAAEKVLGAEYVPLDEEQEQGATEVYLASPRYRLLPRKVQLSPVARALEEIELRLACDIERYARASHEVSFVLRSELEGIALFVESLWPSVEFKITAKQPDFAISLRGQQI